LSNLAKVEVIFVVIPEALAAYITVPFSVVAFPESPEVACHV
jgi:hypothetical protein